MASYSKVEVEGVRNGLEICYRVADCDVKDIVNIITKDIGIDIMKHSK